MKTMKKLSMLIVLVLCITIGGVYATWTYIQNESVNPATQEASMALTGVTSAGNYGTYSVDVSGVAMTVDPKAGTSHTTALYITGNIVLTFTPDANAPQSIKDGAVASTYQLSQTVADWNYSGTAIVASLDTAVKDITWTKNGDGTFTCTISAATLLASITLSEIVLDTKTEYDAYDAVLKTGKIAITVADKVA